MESGAKAEQAEARLEVAEIAQLKAALAEAAAKVDEEARLKSEIAQLKADIEEARLKAYETEASDSPGVTEYEENDNDDAGRQHQDLRVGPDGHHTHAKADFESFGILLHKDGVRIKWGSAEPQLHKEEDEVNPALIPLAAAAKAEEDELLLIVKAKSAAMKDKPLRQPTDARSIGPHCSRIVARVLRHSSRAVGASGHADLEAVRQKQKNNRPSKEQRWRELFEAIDRNGDGQLTRIEFIKSINGNQDLAHKLYELLDMPNHIRQEDGTRDVLVKAFEEMDDDDSGNIDINEFISYLERVADSHVNEQRGALPHAQLGSGTRTKWALSPKPSPSSRRRLRKAKTAPPPTGNFLEDASVLSSAGRLPLPPSRGAPSPPSSSKKEKKRGKDGTTGESSKQLLVLPPPQQEED